MEFFLWCKLWLGIRRIHVRFNGSSLKKKNVVPYLIRTERHCSFQEVAAQILSVEKTIVNKRTCYELLTHLRICYSSVSVGRPFKIYRIMRVYQVSRRSVPYIYNHAAKNYSPNNILDPGIWGLFQYPHVRNTMSRLTTF